MPSCLTLVRERVTSWTTYDKATVWFVIAGIQGMFAWDSASSMVLHKSKFWRTLYQVMRKASRSNFIVKRRIENRAMIAADIEQRK
mmetsp:Transcript_33875/g.57443  ORF Transcript_33875/g.57443 Transcript_33875/m.57443 type:complete len:86 (-) Transcript_33875:91-348(-)